MSSQGVNLVRFDAAEWEIVRQFAQDYLEDPIDPLKAKVCERILASLAAATRSEPERAPAILGHFVGMDEAETLSHRYDRTNGLQRFPGPDDAR